MLPAPVATDCSSHSVLHTWCTGKDSNLRTSLGGTDLQSVGFNHSPTCANPENFGEQNTPESPTSSQLGKRLAGFLADNYTRRKLLDGVRIYNVAPLQRVSAQTAVFPENLFSGAGEGI